MDSLYLIIPAYNEESNIENCINDWYPIVESCGDNSRLVIVNDGSKDNTESVVNNLINDKKQLILLNKKNGGHGSAVLYGYRYAIENNADYIFQTDSDGQTNPKEFKQFWDLRKEYDAILGNRIERGDGKSRKFVENVVCSLLFVIFGVRVPDANAPFRLMKTELVNKYINKLPENYNIPNIMFTTYFKYKKESITFMPISFKPRQKGTNTINVKKIFKIGLNAVGDFIKFKKEIND